MKKLTYCALLALTFAVGCSGTAPANSGLATGSLIVTVSGLTAGASSGSLRQASSRTTTSPPNAGAEVKSIVLTHTGPDGGGTLTITNLTGPITANYDALPVGAYSFSAIAYDGSTPPVELFASSNVPVTVAAKAVAAVNIVLQQVVPGGTVTTTAPVITGIALSNAAPGAGSTVILTASVTAPVPTSQLTFAWTSSCNVSEANTPGDSFSSASSLSTNFTSYCAGVETITFTVTETSAAGGLSASGSIAITYTGEGVAVGLSLHQFPDILTLTSGGNTQPPFCGTLSLTATIDDYVVNDTPQIAWSDNCNGSWQNGNTLTPTWTAPSTAPTGTTPPVACKLTLSITDGLGGTNSGWLTVNVGAPSLTVPTAAPTGVTAAGGNDEVTISWPAVTGATTYNLYWSTTSGVTPANGTQIAGVTSPYPQTGLTDGTTYYYVVTGVNAAGESPPSSQVSAVPQPPPSAPAGVTILPGNQQVTISWGAVTGATSYNLYWSTASGVTPANGTRVAGVTSPYVQTGLANGITYYYVVTAVNSAGESLASPQVSTEADPAGTLTAFAETISPFTPYEIIAGPDGNLWFTDDAGSYIGQITPSGTITNFAVPSSYGQTYGITVGPDGNIWFTQWSSSSNNIARISTSGANYQQFAISTSKAHPMGIAAGPDGRLWFTEERGNKIGAITTGGTITEYSTGLSSNCYPWGITAGPDGNLWFVEYNTSKIGRITTAGTITEFSGLTSGAGPEFITVGPDGNIWFTESNDGAGNVGRILTYSPNTVTEFPLSNSNYQLVGITAGPDGNIWFAEGAGYSVGQILTYSPNTITMFPIATPPDVPYLEGITAGPDGNLWFGFTGSGSTPSIGRLTP